MRIPRLSSVWQDTDRAGRLGGELALAALLLALPTFAVGGPDQARYLDWARVFAIGDFAAMPSQVGSPLGLPLSQWAHGPGLLFGVGNLAVPDLRQAASFVGWLAIVGFWIAMARVLFLVARGQLSIVALCLGALFLGTHAGFYSFNYSTESLSLGFAGVIAWAMLEPGQIPRLRIVSISTATALLIMTRSYLGIYALPGLLAAASVALFDRLPLTAERQVAVTGVRLGSRERLIRLGLLGVPLMLCMLQIGLVNRWMTGTVLRSPYQFAGDGFRSLDWMHPEILAVLVHPWSGLLVYHPLYAAGFGCLLWVAWCSRCDRRRFWLAVSGLLAILVNLYIQAAWYVWWMGTATFAMRGLTVAAIPAMLGIAWVLSELQRRGSRVAWRGWIGVVAVCSTWGFLMLVARPSMLATYGDVLDVARDSARRSWWLVLIIAGLATLPRPAGWRPAGAARAGGLYLSGLALAYTAARVRAHLDGAWGTLMPTIVPALGVSIVIWVVMQSAAAMGRRSRSQLLLTGVTVALLGFLIVGQGLFVQLAIATEGRIARAEVFTGFRFGRDFQIDEVRESYLEYLRIEGFADKKAALRRFLETETGASLPRTLVQPSFGRIATSARVNEAVIVGMTRTR